MKQLEEYVEFEIGESGLIKFIPEESGQIKLHRIEEDLFTLKIFFPKLAVVNPPHENFDEWIQIMLTNLPVNIKNTTELNGWKTNFKVKDFPVMCAMLGIYDGEYIDNNEIEITKVKDQKYSIKWKGFFGETEDPELIDFHLNLTAELTQEITTPLCMWDSELIEIFKPKWYHKIKKLFKRK